MCTLVAVHCAVVAGVAAAAPASSPALSTNWAESVYTSTELLWTTWVSYSVSIKWSFVKDLKSYFSKKLVKSPSRIFQRFFWGFYPKPISLLLFCLHFHIWKFDSEKSRKIIRENSVC